MFNKMHVLGASGASIAAIAVAGALLGPEDQSERPIMSLSVPDDSVNSYDADETPTQVVPEKVRVVERIVYRDSIHEEKAEKPEKHRHHKHRKHIPTHRQLLNALRGSKPRSHGLTGAGLTGPVQPQPPHSTLPTSEGGERVYPTAYNIDVGVKTDDLGRIRVKL
jgi:hypothetical protein